MENLDQHLHVCKISWFLGIEKYIKYCFTSERLAIFKFRIFEEIEVKICWICRPTFQFSTIVGNTYDFNFLIIKEVGFYGQLFTTKGENCNFPVWRNKTDWKVRFLVKVENRTAERKLSITPCCRKSYISRKKFFFSLFSGFFPWNKYFYFLIEKYFIMVAPVAMPSSITEIWWIMTKISCTKKYDQSSIMKWKYFYMFYLYEISPR